MKISITLTKCKHKAEEVGSIKQEKEDSGDTSYRKNINKYIFIYVTQIYKITYM